MTKLILGRFLSTIPVLLVVSFAVFALVEFVPGDPAVTLAGGMNATPQRVEEIRQELALDDPLVVRYWDWLEGAVQLDFGTSLFDGRDVTDEISHRIPVTGAIALGALFFGMLIGFPAGLISGMRVGSVRDKLTVFAASVGLAVPTFWLAIMLIWIFSIELQWFPAVGFTRFSESPGGWFKSLILPSVSLGMWTAAVLARQLRASMMDALSAPYTRTAWAKGLTRRSVVGKHALKNASLPVVTLLGLQLGSLIGGSVIVESIFSIQGMGSYLLHAVVSKDVPAIQGVVVFFAAIQVVLLLFVDVAYLALNPRMRE